ncbi:MAG: FAD-dependent oxidoreductase [Bacteroidota bacterium]
MKKEIKVIGCGVSGLTVALTLIDKGFNVEIITEKLPKQTTSSKAAAIWFPFKVGPVEKVNKWSMESYRIFKELCNIPNSGVSMVPFTVLEKREEDAWWVKAIPENELRKAEKEELPTGYPVGFLLNVPLAETQIYLDFLLDRFTSSNGKLTIKKIADLSGFDHEKVIVVNCTGLSSRELVNDKHLYPIHGQIVKAEPKNGINCIAANFTFEETEDKLAYVVPREDCLVLGGTYIKGEGEINPNNNFTKGIIKRCNMIEPNLGEIKIKSVEVGLRPGRPEIRVEREGNIIHNYGHGGGGFTVSWGCATEVFKLINESD